MTAGEELIERVRSAKVALRRAEIEHEFALKWADIAKARVEQVRTEIVLAEHKLMAFTAEATV